jgi:hypothetical protein
MKALRMDKQLLEIQLTSDLKQRNDLTEIYAKMTDCIAETIDDVSKNFYMVYHN